MSVNMCECVCVCVCVCVYVCVCVCVCVCVWERERERERESMRVRVCTCTHPTSLNFTEKPFLIWLTIVKQETYTQHYWQAHTDSFVFRWTLEEVRFLTYTTVPTPVHCQIWASKMLHTSKLTSLDLQTKEWCTLNNSGKLYLTVGLNEWDNNWVCKNTEFTSERRWLWFSY